MHGPEECKFKNICNFDHAENTSRRNTVTCASCDVLVAKHNKTFSSPKTPFSKLRYPWFGNTYFAKPHGIAFSAFGFQNRIFKKAGFFDPASP